MPKSLYNKLNLSIFEFKNMLYSKHYEQKLSLREISQDLNCSAHCITRWFKKFKFTVKKHTHGDKFAIGNLKMCKKCEKYLYLSCFRKNRNNCVDCEKEYGKIYRKENKKKLIDINKMYRLSNIEKEQARQKEYGLKNRENISKKERERYNNNEEFRIRKNLRARLYQAFLQHNKAKKLSANEYGINYHKIIIYLGPKPSKSHTIDHIIPLSKFDFNNKIHIRAAFLPENHQWLIGSDNFRKGDKILQNEKTLYALSVVNSFLIKNRCDSIIE